MDVDEVYRATKCEAVLEVVREFPRLGFGGGRSLMTTQALLKMIQLVEWNCRRCRDLDCNGACEDRLPSSWSCFLCNKD